MALDIDGPAGRISLAKLEAEHGGLPQTLASRSGRPDGGEHRLFWVPPDLDLAALKNTASHFADGLDVRRHDGQIVVAPSAHRRLHGMDAELRHPMSLPAAPPGW
jgi:hypothetical protein